MGFSIIAACLIAIGIATWLVQQDIVFWCKCAQRSLVCPFKDLFNKGLIVNIYFQSYRVWWGLEMMLSGEEEHVDCHHPS